MFGNQVIWITGASSGIGEALALQFAAAGSKIVLSARREPELERVRDRCLEKGAAVKDVLVLPLDVTDYEAMPAALEKIIQAFGSIDMLINNAGIAQRSMCIDTDMAVYRKIMEVDVLGQIALTKTVLPHMVEQGSGHIAITASVAGKIGAPLHSGYCAAKHAVMGFFDSLRAEVQHQGIRVTTITPGFIRTNISVASLDGEGSEFGKMSKTVASGMDVDRCAETIIRGLRKGTPEIAVGEGQEMKALWLKRLAPGLVFKQTALKAR